MEAIREGKCTHMRTGRQWSFIEYSGGYKLYIGGFRDGIVSKAYFTKNYKED